MKFSPNALCLVIVLSIFFSPYPSARAQIEWRKGTLDIRLFPQDKKVEGTVVYLFQATDKWDSIRMDSRGIDIASVTLDGMAMEHRSGDRYLTLLPTRKDRKNREPRNLRIEFRSTPDKAMYFVGWDDGVEGNEQVWTQGQGKHHSHWFPGFDRSDIKMEYDLTVRTPLDLPVISNGILRDKSQAGGSYIWKFDMEEPMTTYLVALAHGDFDFREGLSASGIVQRWYYPSGAEDRFEPTYRHSLEIFNWLESYLGVPYPWKKYDQVPVRDFMYGGMENTAATFFSGSYLIDSLAFEDVNYVSTNAHELAHQWFGDLVTEKGPRDHWLHEGFASFFGNKAEIRFIGPTHGYWQLFFEAEGLKQYAEEGELQRLDDPEGNTPTFYEKGSWALFVLEDLMGEEKFQRCLREFLIAYRYRNATIDDFMRTARAYSDRDLKGFEQDWIYAEGFPYDQSLEYLTGKEPEIAEYGKIIESPVPTPIIREVLMRSSTSFEYASALLDFAKASGSEGLLYEGLTSPNRNVRKAAVLGLETLPEEYADALWEMSDDPSYMVKERVLLYLWNSGDKYRVPILEKYSTLTGLPNRSLRSLWLALSLVTEGYRDGMKESYLGALKSHSSDLYDPEVRQYAFEYLRLLGILDEDVIDNLVDAAVNPSGYLREFAREILVNIMENPPTRAYLKMSMGRYTDKEQAYLNTVFN